MLSLSIHPFLKMICHYYWSDRHISGYRIQLWIDHWLKLPHFPKECSIVWCGMTVIIIICIVGGDIRFIMIKMLWMQRETSVIYCHHFVIIFNISYIFCSSSTIICLSYLHLYLQHPPPPHHYHQHYHHHHHYYYNYHLNHHFLQLYHHYSSSSSL